MNIKVAKKILGKKIIGITCHSSISLAKKAIKAKADYIAFGAFNQSKTKKTNIGYKKINSSNSISKISVVGVGMRSHAGVAQTLFDTLGKNKINIQVITTSEIKISILIDEKFSDVAVEKLHQAFKLHK